MNFKNHLLQTVIFSALCLIATPALAHEGEKYVCGGKGLNILVELFEAENRAQIIHDGQIFSVVYNGEDGYLNVFQQAQFYTTQNPKQLWVASKRYDCRKYIEGANQSAATFNRKPKGKSLGGNVRDGASVTAKRIGRLNSQAEITIASNTGIQLNGYDWFEIKFKGGIGYQWGGIICSNDVKLDGVLRQCK